MTLGPLPPIHGVSLPVTTRVVAASQPTAATGDATDRDADGRQVLDRFDRPSESESESSPDEPPSPPEPPIAPEDLMEGGLDILV